MVREGGAVAGRVVGTDILLDVSFGDTGIHFEGTIEHDGLIRGTPFVPVLGGRRFMFEMTRSVAASAHPAPDGGTSSALVAALSARRGPAGESFIDPMDADAKAATW